jgi:hypothetical protein
MGGRELDPRLHRDQTGRAVGGGLHLFALLGGRGVLQLRHRGYSRRVVGWQFSTSMRTDLVLDALRMALTRREHGADVELIHHSDAGSQYTSFAFRQGSTITACSHRSARSATRSTTRWPRASSTLQSELIADRAWQTRSQLELAIVEWAQDRPCRGIRARHEPLRRFCGNKLVVIPERWVKTGAKLADLQDTSRPSAPQLHHTTPLRSAVTVRHRGTLPALQTRSRGQRRPARQARASRHRASHDEARSGQRHCDRPEAVPQRKGGRLIFLRTTSTARETAHRSTR